MDLVTDMDSDVKKAMRPNVFGITFCPSHLSWIIFHCLNPEVRSFTYSVMMRKDYEGTSCYVPLGESSVSASRSTSVGFWSILERLTWWLYPRWWDPYPVEGIVLSDMASIPYSDAGSSIMSLVATWVSDPGGRSWEPGSSDSSCQSFLGRFMSED